MSDTNKALGQHWLHDPEALRAILAAADVSKIDTVLEIGPGTGHLTRLLAGQAKQLIAVEIDSELVAHLKQFLSEQNIVIANQDIRRFNLHMLPKDYIVVANLPYYLSSFILRQLFDSSNPPSSITVVVQKEVAERLAAQPGNMSLLSLAAQLFGTVSLGRVIKAELFEPPPKVDSQIVHLVRHPSYPIDSDKKLFFRVVKCGFASRRKKLLNNLASGLLIDKALLKKTMAEVGFDENTRAQELELSQWDGLIHSLEPLIPSANTKR